MDFREWQASYGPVLHDIKVCELDLSHARDVALRMWDFLVSQEKLGYGVFKARSETEYVEWMMLPVCELHGEGTHWGINCPD